MGHNTIQIIHIKDMESEWCGLMFLVMAGDTRKCITILKMGMKSKYKVSVLINSTSNSQNYQDFYQNFEDFFRNSQEKYEQQKQSWRQNFDDFFNEGESGMTRQEAYKILGLT